jgi:ring-1,2-phenylacetyl-CoA epoxidase subunit PaaE
MGLFGFLKKDKDAAGSKKGFFELKVAAVEKLTADTVKVVLDVPQELKNEFHFIPGQYLDFSVPVNGKDEHRSYSICSGPGESLAIAVKEISKGTVSRWFNHDIFPGSTLFVSKPKGSFTLKEGDRKVVAIAAGSGITPIMSIGKDLEKKGGQLTLFFGNRNQQSILFSKELEAMSHTTVKHYLSGQDVEGFGKGRINKDSFTHEIKSDLSLLKADAFFICGPEQMIIEVADTLKFFGVAESKIHFELFTTPVLMKAHETNVISNFEGSSKIKVILDSEVAEFELGAKGKTLLEAVEKAGMDAPYSCKGGVCSSCRAKILKGSAMMTSNFSLTDEDIKKGYILTCQAHPTSEELSITFDE